MIKIREKELKQESKETKNVAEILSLIKDKGYKLSEYDKGLIQGILQCSKPN